VVSGEPRETPRTRCSLRQSPLMTRFPRSPGSTLVLSLNQETVHDFILLFMPPCGPHLTRWPPGPSNEADLSSPHLEASPATTFRACSSPAPTPVKPQPASAILTENQSTQRCQSLITKGSNHPPVLEPLMVLNCLSESFSKNLNKSGLSFEYESCRSSHPLQLSKRLYGVFLHRF
jgi:hypothetical protein